MFRELIICNCRSPPSPLPHPSLSLLSLPTFHSLCSASFSISLPACTWPILALRKWWPYLPTAHHYPSLLLTANWFTLPCLSHRFLGESVWVGWPLAERCPSLVQSALPEAGLRLLGEAGCLDTPGRAEGFSKRACVPLVQCLVLSGFASF